MAGTITRLLPSAKIPCSTKHCSKNTEIDKQRHWMRLQNDKCNLSNSAQPHVIRQCFLRWTNHRDCRRYSRIVCRTTGRSDSSICIPTLLVTTTIWSFHPVIQGIEHCSGWPVATLDGSAVLSLQRYVICDRCSLRLFSGVHVQLGRQQFMAIRSERGFVELPSMRRRISCWWGFLSTKTICCIWNSKLSPPTMYWSLLPISRNGMQLL